MPLTFAAASKAFFHTLAGSDTIKQAASRYGMRRPSSFARRFIAGETVDEAIAAARVIEQAGPPLEIYRRPATRFVGEFVGDSNFFAGTVTDAPAGRVRLGIEPPPSER